MPERRRLVAITGGLALVLAAAYLLAPPMGTDLSAQSARAGFFSGYAFAPLDLGWYGGISPLGYSLISPPLMALLGPPPVGALAAVASALALVLLMARTGAPRPLLGGLLGAACIAGNLVSGRVTYALGVAFGLLALLSLTTTRPLARRVGAGVLALLAAVTSPVAGLFVGLAGVALLAGGRGRRWDAAVLAGSAGVPLLVLAALFGAGGWMNISWWDAVRAVTASLLVAALVPRRVIRLGALLSAAGVAVAFAVATPVGLNAVRLAAMFAVPVLAGYARLPAWRLPAVWRDRRSAVALGLVLAAVAVWQPPVSVADLRAIDDPSARRGYFAPLLAELERRAPIGRVEVVPTANYWESAYLPPTVPLARGWLRQADLERNGIFFDGTLSAASYADWLAENAVSYVAVAAAPPSWVGRGEAALIATGPPYLRQVWQSDSWRLYQVTDSGSRCGAVSECDPITGQAAVLVESTPGRVVFRVDGPTELTVRVRWSRWLRLTGGAGCIAAGPGGWTQVRAAGPGTFELSSTLVGERGHCG